MSAEAEQTSIVRSRDVTLAAPDLEATIALYKQANRLARLALPPSDGAAAVYGPGAAGRSRRLNHAPY
jgi:hypothetical protein